jgi:hypothetical protein
MTSRRPRFTLRLACDALVETRQPIIGQPLPGSGVGDELVRLRLYSGIAVDRAETHDPGLTGVQIAGE